MTKQHRNEKNLIRKEQSRWRRMETPQKKVPLKIMAFQQWFTPFDDVIVRVQKQNEN